MIRARILWVFGLSAVFACSAAAGNGFDGNGGSGGGDDAGSHHSSGGGGGGGTLSDGGILPDGGGGTLDDGSAPTSRITCGSSFCRGDQSCVSSSCQYTCTGTQVPGDYATIQAAINATINGGNDVTICLKSQTYGENVSITGSVTTPKKVTIQGISAGSTTITSLSASGAPFSALSVRGVAFTSNVEVSSATAPVEFVGDKLASSSSYALYDYAASDVTVDGCDLSASTSEYAIYFYGYYNGPAQKLTVKNSYLHDSGYGAYISTGSYSSSSIATISFVNDTFNNDNTSIYTYGSGMPLALTYANDLIVNSKTYGVDQEASNETITTKDNALFGNANNYAGSAVDGAGYVKDDVKLDTSQSPPGLSAGSPARATADSSMSPPVDFWDVARPTSPDIGAVQN
ncbi:MAG: hypothetical protein ACRELY_15930 [Polyangiaceae bacterium]